MCCQLGKCFLCIPVEKGCFVIAIIIAVVSGCSFVVNFILGALTAGAVIFQKDYRMDGSRSYETRAESGLAVAFFMLAFASAISFVFVAGLCLGISKRHLGLVKAYFIYGVTATALGAVATLVTSLCGSMICLLILAGCVTNSLFLVLVHHTYFKLLEDARKDASSFQEA